jgi:predicted transcriptional regulator
MPERRGVVHHPTSQTPLENVPVMPVENSFQAGEIICLICGKGGMKTLARHLNFIHNMKAGQYRKLFGLKSDRLLTSKNYSEARRRFAEEHVTPESLGKARAALLAGCKGGDQGGVVVDNRPSDKRSYFRRHIFSDPTAK